MRASLLATMTAAGRLIQVMALFLLGCDLASATSTTVWLHELDLTKMTSGWQEPRANRSVEDNALRVAGTSYERGVGTHAYSEMWIDLQNSAESFSAFAGIDDEVSTEASVIFEVWVDGKRSTATEVIRGGVPPVPIVADLRGAKQMTLVVQDANDGIDFDHANWIDAKFVLRDGARQRPRAILKPETPLPKIVRPAAKKIGINNPTIVGATPGRPFLFRIPVSGPAPFRVECSELPDSLQLNPGTGVISGISPPEGTYPILVKATSLAKDNITTAQQELTIVSGSGKLALTPPMGWNSWNAWGVSLDDGKIREAADWMVKSGLAAHGYSYIVIDDGWQGRRTASGVIQSNSKFPDMKGLAEYVHSRGLKIGIYSSPGPKTCQGYSGSYEHEEADARTYAEWGMDYLKYDWCSYSRVVPNTSREELRKPYEVMRRALDACLRDMVYSLCQYGAGNVWEWGADVGGNLWRTTGDISDTWGNMSYIGFSQSPYSSFAGPGHWNDPDMLVVGTMGWGANMRSTRLTRHEQITHLSLWSLLAAPLMVSCDLSKLDDFTRALLTNDEVISINQDVLGKAATRLRQQETTEVWARPLADGSVAVGLFNRGLYPASIRISWDELGILGNWQVRNVWERADVGSFDSEYGAEVASHGCVLLRFTRGRAD